MFQIRGFGAIDQGNQGGQGENYDEYGQYQTGSGGGGSSVPGMKIPKTYGTKYWGPSPGAYTSPPTTAPPILFPPPNDMPLPLPQPEAPPIGPQDVPTAGANIVPIVVNQPPPGYMAVGTRVFPKWWLFAGVAVGAIGGVILFLARR